MKKQSNISTCSQIAVILFLALFSTFTLSAQVRDIYGNAVSSDLCNQLQFNSDKEVERLVTRILEVYNLDNAYIVGACSRVDNCVATKDDRGKPYILYNPDFLKKIKVFSFTGSDMPTETEDWGVLLVLAHEIGHHLNNHVTNPHPDLDSRDLELKADETAGYLLYLLNAPDLQTADKGLRVPQVPEEGSYTHPPRSQRLDAFKKGWDKAAERFPRPGTIQSLNCSAASVMGVLTAGKEAAGVTVSVPYTGGDGGNHGGQSALSSGVAGLTATLAGGRFSLGDGTLQYIITGAPFTSGTAQFALNIGGKTCMLSVSMGSECGAYVDKRKWKEFMCHNLGVADLQADPFTPSWEIIGGYWQWGQKEMAASGPSGPGKSQINDREISGWNTNGAPNGSWRDNVKTANDPCPTGFRVPTREQWDGVLEKNKISRVGTWESSSINYNSGLKIGDKLLLPAAGGRYGGDGALSYRGYYGHYWSSTENGNYNAWHLYFNSSGASTGYYDRAYGLSVRCVAE